MYYSIVILALGLVASGYCGIIDRTVDTIGEAAETLHEGVGEAWETGKHIMFGKPEGGPDLVDHGIIPGIMHTFAEGIHKIGEGIHHIFAGDEEEHLGLLNDKQTVGQPGKVGPNSGPLADPVPITNGPASVVHAPGPEINPAMSPNAGAPNVNPEAPSGNAPGPEANPAMSPNAGAPIVNPGSSAVNAPGPETNPVIPANTGAPLVNAEPPKVNPTGPLVNAPAPVAANTAGAVETAPANAAGKVANEAAKAINPR